MPSGSSPMDSSLFAISFWLIPASISKRTRSVLMKVAFPRLPLPNTETVIPINPHYVVSLGQDRGKEGSDPSSPEERDEGLTPPRKCYNDGHARARESHYLLCGCWCRGGILRLPRGESSRRAWCRQYWAAGAGFLHQGSTGSCRQAQRLQRKSCISECVGYMVPTVYRGNA